MRNFLLIRAEDGKQIGKVQVLDEIEPGALVVMFRSDEIKVEPSEPAPAGSIPTHRSKRTR